MESVPARLVREDEDGFMKELIPIVSNVADAPEDLLGFAKKLTTRQRRILWLTASMASSLASRHGVDVLGMSVGEEEEKADDNVVDDVGQLLKRLSNLGSSQLSMDDLSDDDEMNEIDDEVQDILYGDDDCSEDREMRYYCSQLSASAREGVLPESVVTQIRKDLRRSGVKDKSRIKMLENVLMAYAVRNPSIGYSQGMNFLVVRCMSLNMTEEQCFWMLSAIVERVLPPSYFDEHLTDVIVDMQVCQDLLSRHLPDVDRSLRENNVETGGQVSSMLMTLFENNVCSAVVHLVWDFIFVLSFEKFAIALIMAFFAELEHFMPPDTGNACENENNITIALMSTTQRWQKYSAKQAESGILLRGLRLLSVLPHEEEVKRMRTKVKAKIRLERAFLEDKTLEIRYRRAEEFLVKLRRTETILKEPLLSTSRTAKTARAVMRGRLHALIDLIEKHFPDLFQDERSKSRRWTRLASSSRRFSDDDDDGEVIDGGVVVVRAAYRSEDQVLDHAANVVAALRSTLSTALAKSVPSLRSNLSDLERELREASTRAEPVLQLVGHIVKSVDEAKAHVDTVTTLLIVKRWLVEKPLWASVPPYYVSEMRRSLDTISLLLINSLQQTMPSGWSRLELALADALESWNHAETDCHLYTPLSNSRAGDDHTDQERVRKASSLYVQWMTLRAHHCLLARIRDTVSAIKPNATRALGNMIRDLTTAHEIKMRTSSFANCALRQLESAESLIRKHPRRSSHVRREIVMKIDWAKHYASEIPDGSWRVAIERKADAFLRDLTTAERSSSTT